jgi:8-oxo-dGTP pyrophosphatase MutT (NUDIX family)
VAAKDADQAAVIPIRRMRGTIEICLICRRGSARWGIPKGFIEDGASPEDAALQEADEEAGLRGVVRGGSVGSYTYTKRGTSLRVAVFVMDVQRQRRIWREIAWRKRKWFPSEQAVALLKKHAARPLLERFLASAAG